MESEQSQITEEPGSLKTPQKPGQSTVSAEPDKSNLTEEPKSLQTQHKPGQSIKSIIEETEKSNDTEKAKAFPISEDSETSPTLTDTESETSIVTKIQEQIPLHTEPYLSPSNIEDGSLKHAQEAQFSNVSELIPITTEAESFSKATEFDASPTTTETEQSQVIQEKESPMTSNEHQSSHISKNLEPIKREHEHSSKIHEPEHSMRTTINKSDPLQVANEHESSSSLTEFEQIEGGAEHFSVAKETEQLPITKEHESPKLKQFDRQSATIEDAESSHNTAEINEPLNTPDTEKTKEESMQSLIIKEPEPPPISKGHNTHPVTKEPSSNDSESNTVKILEYVVQEDNPNDSDTSKSTVSSEKPSSIPSQCDPKLKMTENQDDSLRSYKRLCTESEENNTASDFVVFQPDANYGIGGSLAYKMGSEEIYHRERIQMHNRQKIENIKLSLSKYQERSLSLEHIARDIFKNFESGKIFECLIPNKEAMTSFVENVGRDISCFPPSFDLTKIGCKSPSSIEIHLPTNAFLITEDIFERKSVDLVEMEGVFTVLQRSAFHLEKKRFHHASEYDQILKSFQMVGIDAFSEINTFQKANQDHTHLPDKNNQNYEMSCLYFETATWSPKCETSKVKSGALQKLKEIDKYLNNGFVCKAFQLTSNFFNHFGSHFYVGEVVYGGALHSGDHSKTNLELYTNESEHQILQRLLTISLPMDTSKSSKKSKSPENSKAFDKSIESFLFETAGSREISLPLWQMIVSENPKLWENIRSGSLNSSDYKTIWHLVKEHDNSFMNAHELSQFLSICWEKLNSVDQHAVLVFRREMDLLPRVLTFIKESASSGDVSQILTDLLIEATNMSKEALSEVRKEFETHNIAHVLMDNAIKHPDQDETVVFALVIELIYILEGSGFSAGGKLINFAISALKNIPTENKTRAFQSLYDVRFALKRVAENPLETIRHDIQWTYLRMKDEVRDILAYVQCEYVVRKSIFGLRRKDSCLPWLLFLRLLLTESYNFEALSFKTSFGRNTMKIFIQALDATEMHLEDLKSEYTRKTEKDCKQLLQASVLFELFEAMEQRYLENQEDFLHEIYAPFRSLLCFPLGLFPSLRKLAFDTDKSVTSIKQDFHLLIKDRRSDMKQAKTNTFSWEHFERKPDSFFETYQKETSEVHHSMTVQSCKQKNFMKLLQLMHLSEKYPGKISLSDVHAIDIVSPKTCTSIADLPWVILRKIISVDSSFRDEIIEEYLEKKHNSGEQKHNNDLNFEEENISLHPSDVIFAIFLCCDMFLQKTIMTKFSFCQFAVPFVYPRIEDDSLMMSLWCLRDIYIGDVSSLPVSSIKRVSFIRLGEINEQSKSELIDEFLRDQNEEHSTFFHHDCPLGENLRLVSNGIIEMSWFIPSIDDIQSVESNERAKENKTLTEPFLLFNLRDDGAIHVKQVQLLSDITDIMVVLSENETINDEKYGDLLRHIHTKTSCILFVTSKFQDNKTREKMCNTYMKEKQIDKERSSFLFLFENKKKKNASKRRAMLRSEIQSMMKGIKAPKPLEHVCIKVTTSLDEMDYDCQQGKQLADSLFKTIMKNESSTTLRKEFLPLQGEEMWVKWSRLLKERSRIKRNTESKTSDDKEYLEMEKIRLNQIESCNKFMSNFIEIMFTTRENKRVLSFFLAWMKYNLDRLSKTKLPALEKKFCIAFESYEKSRSESDKSKLREAKVELSNASFCIEHIFLELSQIYEAFIRQGEKINTFIEEKTMVILTALPSIVSDLLLSGYILQILDGEASNIPLTWIKAVFDSIELRKGNAKISSVSVLGIQSSGKSTLLNSMFGLQFNVSAGRCTRGVFTQLIPVRAKGSLKSDYLMVIDTEGLRAPELSDYSFNHDNELATFAIGLGDFALINIKGETISDMKDVLEIVVHGLLRLKQANKSLQFSQSCTFIHQNVSAKDAKDKMLQGHQETLNTLDDITKEIAVNEGIQGVNAFKDVLDFNPQSSIKYIPDLWHGSPPMAPTSTKYSSKVLEIVDVIRGKMAGATNIHTVSDAFSRLHDLWNGILKEDFVFSFRNSLEVKAYNSLDIEFKKLGWEMEVAKQEWIDQNVVKSLNDLQRREDLTRIVADLRAHFLCHLTKISQETKEKVSQFINDADSKDQMMHWKERFIKRIDTLKDDLVSDYDKRVQEKSNICIVRFSEKTILTAKEKTINERAHDLAKTLKKEKLSDAQLKMQFENMFEAWMKEIEHENPSLPEETKLNTEVEMNDHIKDILLHLYSSHTEKVLFQLRKRPITGKEECEKLVDYFSNTTKPQGSSRWPWNWSWPFTDKNKNTIWKKNVIQILSDIDAHIQSTKNTKHRLGKTEFSTILKQAQHQILMVNKRKHDLNIDINVEIDIAVLVSRKCYHVFVDHNKEFIQQNSLRNKLGKSKEKTFKRFLSIFSEVHKDLIAADSLSDDMEEMIWNTFNKELKKHTESWILTRYNFKKMFLMKDILCKLVLRSEFKSFMKFVKFPDSFVLKYIINETEQDFFEAGDGSSKFEIWACSFIRNTVSHITSTLDSISKKYGDDLTDDWKLEFAAALSDAKYDLSNDPLSQLKNVKITDFNQFKNSVSEHLHQKQDLLEVRIQEMKRKDMREGSDSPYNKAYACLWGCTEKCPMCAEPCSRETKHESDIKHRCVQHRASGIFGVRWTLTDKLGVENCNVDIGANRPMGCDGNKGWCKTCPKETDCTETHYLREYNKYIPDWDIPPQTDNEGSKFWSWFMCKYSKELAEHFGHKEADIPSSWRDIAEDDALKSLDETYKTKM